MPKGIYIRTEINKENLSKARKGKKLSEKHKKNIGIVQEGRKITWGDKISKTRKEYFKFHKHNRIGYKYSEKAKENMSIATRGERNSQWQGGISFEPYTPSFNQQLKDRIRVRDNFICQKCGMPELECNRRLTTHHIDYDKKNCEEDNLTSLCVRCNSEVNINREYWTEYFQNKLKQKYLEKLNDANTCRF